MGHLCVDARGLCKSSLTFNTSQAVLSCPLPQVSPSLHTRQRHYPSPSPMQTPSGEGGHPWSRPLPTTPTPSNPLAGPGSFTWKKYLQEHVVCTYDGKLFSQEKKEKTLTFATTEMDLEDTVLSEISQTQEGKYCTISFIQRNLK